MTRGAPAAARLSRLGSGGGRALQGRAYRCAGAWRGVRKHAVVSQPLIHREGVPCWLPAAQLGACVLTLSSLGNTALYACHIALGHRRALVEGPGEARGWAEALSTAAQSIWRSGAHPQWVTW